MVLSSPNEHQKGKATERHKQQWLQPDYFDNIVRNGLMRNNTFSFWNILRDASGQDYRAYLKSYLSYLDLKKYSEKRKFMRLIFNSSLEENKDIAVKINSTSQEGLILDLGCGVCTLYDLLSKENKALYYGIDIAADILKEFSNAPRNRLIPMDLFDCEGRFRGKCSSVVDCHVGSKLNRKLALEDLAKSLLLFSGKYYTE
jgi:SAM-dependent methyltransferase